jgi:hypothetical protein
MGRRALFRQSNGRFRRPTLERDFGIKAWICDACDRINTRAVGEGRPDSCHACGASPFIDRSDRKD